MSSGHIVRACPYAVTPLALRPSCARGVAYQHATHTGHVGRDSGLGSVGRGPCVNFRLSRQDAVESSTGFQALFIDFSFVFVVCVRDRARARATSVA